MLVSRVTMRSRITCDTTILIESPSPYGTQKMLSALIGNRPDMLLRRAFEAHCRLATGGYTALESVLSVPPPQRDKMESFWLAETLKCAVSLPRLR